MYDIRATKQRPIRRTCHATVISLVSLFGGMAQRCDATRRNDSGISVGAGVDKRRDGGSQWVLALLVNGVTGVLIA